MLTGPGRQRPPEQPYAPTAYLSALKDFREARRRATIERLLARLRGKSADLLCYPQVRELLQPTDSPNSARKTISLDAIAGSVERCTDYTRSFLPVKDSDEQRWTRVKEGVESWRTVAPIDVFQISQVYFVIDGHHRVSVARMRGQAQIDARVIEIETRVPLTPDLQPDDLRVKSEYAAFLERTRLDETRPLADLTATLVGQYKTLEAQIEHYARFLQVERGTDPGLVEAASQWYEQVYCPRLQRLREQGALDEFPGWTETDLYLGVCQHQADLEAALGWEVELELAAADLARQADTRPRRRLARASRGLFDSVIPDGLQSGPRAGTWRRQRRRSKPEAIREEDCLFSNILVPCSGKSPDWPAVAQAAEIACREGAQLLGLHVAATKEQAGGEPARAMQAEFERHCQAVGVQGRLQVEVGRVAHQICERSRWADLIVLGLAHPPAPRLSARLASDFCAVVRRCATPVLAVPGGAFSPLSRPLLAYDGGPKAREALFVATYLAARGRLPLAVISIDEDHLDTQAALDGAREYLENQGVPATYLKAQGPVAATLLETAKESGNDLVIMGGYGHTPLREIVLGSTVDEVLRGSEVPVLVCR